MAARSSIVRSILVVTTLLGHFGCNALTYQQLNRELGSFKKVYKPTLKMQVNKKDHFGVAILPLKEQYEIKISSKNNLDTLWITSCHRAIEVEDEGKDFEFNYKPVRGLEDKSACILDIEGYNKNLLHAWGMAIVSDQLFRLPASLECSGDVQQTIGIGACISLPDQKERISFTEEVRLAKHPDATCQLSMQKSGSSFYFWPPAGRCAHVFKGKKEKYLLYTIGYRRAVREND